MGANDVQTVPGLARSAAENRLLRPLKEELQPS